MRRLLALTLALACCAPASAAPVPVIFGGPSLVSLARSYGAKIIAKLDESSGTTFADSSGNNASISGPATHITYRNPSLVRGIARSVGYDGSQTADIIGPVLAAGSFTVVQFVRISSSVSNTGNFPALVATNAPVYYNQGWELYADTTSSGSPWTIRFVAGYSATAQAGNSLYSQVASANVLAANTDYAVVGVYNASALTLTIYLRASGASAATLVASGAITSAMTASPTGITFGDAVAVTGSNNMGWTGPGLYFPSVLSVQQINTLTSFVQ